MILNNTEREIKSMETLKYCKVRKVKTPTRAHATDAGIDFFVPEDLTAEVMAKKCETTGCDVEMELAEDGKTVKCCILKPNESILIPSGIKMKVPEGYMLQYNNKSGVASKRGLLVGASVVDVGYEGECHINLHNVSKFRQIITAGDKIVQGILVPVGFHNPEEVKDEHELYGGSMSERGEGGFGSSGVK